MRWQGLALIAVGGLSFVIWRRGLRLGGALGRRRPGDCPTFDVDSPEAQALAPPTTHLMQEVRRIRRGQKRAEG
jgi:hypothetical protein